MTKLSHACPAEAEAARRVKAVVEELFDTGHLNHEKLAKALGLLPQGAENLMAKSWPLSHAFRIAAHLGLEPDLVLRAVAEDSPSEPSA